MANEHNVRLTVNGTEYERTVEARVSLADFLRHGLELTGTHLGCEHGVCGACTILLDGAAVRSCLLLAVQADGANVTTIEGLASLGGAAEGQMHPLQEAFREKHALQCGFCTPGFLLTAHAFLEENPSPTEQDVRTAVSGNLCRCTGYVGIVEAILEVANGVEPRTEGGGL